MKNKFGFIPIVLPVLVMVLIIGLINLTGPQGVQAQGNVDESDARLKSLTLMYAQQGETDAEASIPVPLTQEGSGSEGFLSSVADYTAMVDNAVTRVTVDGMHPDEGTVQGEFRVVYSIVDSRTSPWSVVEETGVVTLGTEAGPNAGKATVRVVVTEQGTFEAPAVRKMATYMIELTKKGPDISVNSPRLAAPNGLRVTYEGPPGDTDTEGVTLFRKGYGGGQIAFNAGIKSYVATVPYTAQQFVITAIPGDGAQTGNSVTISGDRVDGKMDSSNVSPPDTGPETSTVALGGGR